MDGWKDKGDQLTFDFQIFPNPVNKNGEGREGA